MLSGQLLAQPIDFDNFKNWKARSIGPAGMSGRVTAIDVVEREPSRIYIGTASGGVWMSNSGGINWKPVFDKQPIQNIGALKIQQSNPSVIWVGTGEGNPRNSQSSGAGIYKSIDGGRTWQFKGLKETKSIHRILIDPTDADVVYVGATGSAWGTNKERGVYKSIDGGNSWNKILYVNDTTGCADLVMDPANPNKIYAAMWSYLRQPWFFTSGGEGSGLYITYDGGKTWRKKTEKEGLPKGKLGRIGIAPAPSSPNIVYALIESEKNGLYKSTDGGEHWSLVSTKDIGNRPFYYSEIYVDPSNENRIYNLWSRLSVSEDGGRTFKITMPYTRVHPDHQAFYISPSNPKFLINGNDGGLNISMDGGVNWRFVENLPLAQFYHINYDEDLPYNVYGGMQDNGSWVGPSEVWQVGGIRNAHWQEVGFGDGFDVVPFPKNSRYGYSMSQGGNVSRYDRETGKSTFIQPNHPNGETLRYNWNAGIEQSPYDDSTIFFGSQYVHKSTNAGDSWEIISPDLTTNDTAKQRQAKSGGLTIDATRAENYTSILCIEQSPVDENVIWASTDDGNLQVTKDGGKTWKNVASALKGLPKGSWIPQVVASRTNANSAFVVANNYRRNDWKPYVYRTTDGGKSFGSLVDENIEGYCLSIAEDVKEERLIFLGTEQGLYISIDKGYTWSKWTNGYPSASTMDLKVQPRAGDLVIGTFGRAAYILDDLNPLRQLAKEGEDFFEKEFAFVDGDQPGYHVSMKSYSGTHFAGDAMFKGKNNWPWVKMRLWIKDPGKLEKDKPKKGEEKDEDESPVGKVELKIYKGNELIRTIRGQADTGLVMLTWDMRNQGQRYAQHRTPGKNALPPGGARAMPGTYKVVASYKKWKDSTMVTIANDPRTKYNADDWNKWYPYVARIDSAGARANRSFEALKEAEKNLGMLQRGFVKNVEDDSLKKNVNKEIKALKKEIKSIKELYITAKDFDGYDHVTVRLNNKLGRARNFVYGTVGTPGGNAMDALEDAEKSTEEILVKVRAFFKEKYNPFMEKQTTRDLLKLKEINTRF